MNAVLNIGKYLYAIPFAVFGIFHFMNANDMAGMAFGSSILVYLTGACLIAATVSIFLGKYDKLATVLLAVFLLLTAFVVHAAGISADNPQGVSNMLKDLSLSGAAMMYAKNLAKDPAVIGA